MLNLVSRFVTCARSGGLKISTSEVLDCLGQIPFVDVLDEPQFAAVLRANFAKSRREQSKFDHIYHLFFHELRNDIGIGHAEGFEDRVHTILEGLKSESNNEQSFQAILNYLGGNPSYYLEEIVYLDSRGGRPDQGMGSNLGSLVRRLQIVQLLNRVDADIADYLTQNRNRINWETRQDLRNHFQARSQSARRLLLQTTRPYEEDQGQTQSYQRHLGRLGQIPFASLTAREIEEMRDVIEQLVRKLKDKVTLRYARQKRGILDVKKTLRRAARHQGTPMELVFRNRPPRKGKIVTLCDVSNSVWSSARFMLNMIYSLQECFIQVRTFIFVAGLDEVTQIFENYEINQAITKVLGEADVNYSASTDYGVTLRQFKKRHMDILNKKTTLIIIGDARTNYANPEEGILEEMRERCRRVVWLNPETTLFWNSGDSEMRTYQPHCHEVRLCQNLNQLLDFIQKLVL